MKITCLGAGGRYFLNPLGHIAANARLRGSRIALYDIDHERAAMMADAARRFSAEASPRLCCRWRRASSTCASFPTALVRNVSTALAQVRASG